MRNIAVFILSLAIVSWIHFQVLQNYKIKHHVAIKKSKIKQQIIQIQMASIATSKPIIKPVKKPEIEKQKLPKLISKTKKIVESIAKPIIRAEIKKETLEKSIILKPTKHKIKKKSVIKKNKKVKIAAKPEKPVKKKPTKKKPAKNRRKVTTHKASSLAMRQKKSSTGKASKNKYLSKVRRIIERYKRYPRVSKRLGEQGVVYMRFTIASSGIIRHVSVARTSRHSRLNKAATKILRNIGSFPPIPKSVGRKLLTITLPIRYKL